MRIVAALCICLVSNIAAGSDWSMRDLEDDIDRLFTAYDGNVPGASVGIYRDGAILFEKAYGLAEVEMGQAATVQTAFRLASVSKAFTAMAIAMLAERGALSLDDRLRTHIPNFPSYGNNITIRHLLTHQSGLRNYESHIPGDRSEQLLDADVVDILMGLNSGYFTPGTQYRYSNSGYATLADIVARVSGQRFSAFLRDNIFVPLGMDGTVAFENGVNEVPERAYGYTQSGNGWRQTDQSITSAVLGDGGVYTSVRDYFLWDQALHDESLVSSAMLQQIFTPGQLRDGRTTSYGFGWVIDTYQGRRRVSHTGSTVGFRTAVQRFPDDRTTVLVLVNRAYVSPWQKAEQIASMILD